MQAEKRSGIKGFAPVHGKTARAVILGSYPSPKSFAEGFYYGHPQNRFWPLLAALCGTAVPTTIEEKKALILNNRLALWDALESCTILGAADSTIESPVPNDIAALLEKTGASAVFCNGAAAHRVYRRYCEAAAGVAAVRLPSTSAANAACGAACLLEAWAPLKAYLPGGKL